MRTVTPFVIGMSRIPVWEFMVPNLLGATLWAILVGSAGYFFGAALTSELGQIKHYEHLIMAAIVTAGALFWIINYGRARAGRRDEQTGEDAK